MSAVLYTGELLHSRTTPVGHSFVYAASFVAVDLATLVEAGPRSRVFGYNRRAFLFIRDRDYLDADDQPLIAKLEHRMPGIDHTRTILVTSPRSLLPAFNPLSLYLAYGADGTLRRMGAEVSNTFQERYFYDLQPVTGPDGVFAAETAKRLYVSPFHGTAGYYHFSGKISPEHFDLRVDLIVDGATLIHTRLRGAGEPLPTSLVSRGLMRAAATGALAHMRIMRQALRLRLRGLAPVMKPHPPADALRGSSRR